MNMYRMLGVCGLALLAVAPSARAQKWEFGGGVGGSFYLSRDISNGSAKASAGIATNIASGIWLGENLSNKWGGEIRYDYQRGDLQLKSGGASTSFSGDTHAVHYDILWHATPRGSKVRPFLGVGAGFKVYRGTGAEIPSQPLSQFELLTKGNQLEALLSLGAGVKWQVAPSFQVRLEVHDYITPFPKEIIAPNTGSHVSGVLQNIVPMIAIAYTF